MHKVTQPCLQIDRRAFLSSFNWNKFNNVNKTRKDNVILQLEFKIMKIIKPGVRCAVCVQSAVLTILLVEPPQLDLVSFVLGLLLQSAGPGNGGKESIVILWNRKLCSSIPVLHMIPLLCLPVHTGSSWRAMSGACISKL